MAKRGPKPIPINWDDAARMARVHCPIRDIAAILKVSHDTLAKRCESEQGMKLAEFMDLNRGSGRQILRNLQLKSAAAGSIAMQIWLGKQWLGQTDRIVKYDVDWARSQDKEALLKAGREAIATLGGDDAKDS